jgi:hypothetical protein
MDRRAASMAETAKHLSNPQDIQAMQQRLVTGIQNGSIQPYIGIPLIQQLTQKLTEAKAQAAQTAMGGMPQGQGAAPSAPIAQQVMQQATRAPDSTQGIPALPSNLPQSYAGGGIIAFEGGGEVERFDVGGSTSPAGRFFSGLKQDFTTSNDAAELRNKLQMQYGPASAVPGLFMQQSDAERQAAKDVTAALPTLNLDQLKLLSAQGPSALAGFNKTPAATPTPFESNFPASTVKPAATPLAGTAPTTAPLVGGPGSTPGGINTQIAPLNLPKGPLTRNTETGELYEAPLKRIDTEGIISALPDKLKTAAESAVKEKMAQLNAIDDPLQAAENEKLAAREGRIDKDATISRLLSIAKGGLKMAAGKSRNAIQNIAEGGEEMAGDLIKGEAANRLAKDRMEDYRDNLARQQTAAKKGNLAAADAAGNRASDDLRQATTLQLTGAHYTNTEAGQQQQIQQQGVIAQGQQNLGLAGLRLQEKGLAQTGAYQQGTLAMQKQRYEAMDKASQARLMQVRSNALNTFVKEVAPGLRTTLSKDPSKGGYGPNWETGKDPRSLEAQMIFKQAQDAHLANALNQHDERMSYGRSADELLQAGQ